jgi:hypothetical protein
MQLNQENTQDKNKMKCITMKWIFEISGILNHFLQLTYLQSFKFKFIWYMILKQTWIQKITTKNITKNIYGLKKIQI